MGPAPAPIERLHNRWRWHFLLRAGAAPRGGPLGRVLSGDSAPASPPRQEISAWPWTGIPWPSSRAATALLAPPGSARLEPPLLRRGSHAALIGVPTPRMFVGCSGCPRPGDWEPAAGMCTRPGSLPEEWPPLGCLALNAFVSSPSRWSPPGGPSGLCWIAGRDPGGGPGAGLPLRRPGTPLPVGDPPGALRPRAPAVPAAGDKTPSSSHGTTTPASTAGGTGANYGVASFLTRDHSSCRCPGGGRTSWSNVVTACSPLQQPGRGTGFPERRVFPSCASPAEPNYVHLVWAVRRVTAVQGKYIAMFYGEDATAGHPAAGGQGGRIWRWDRGGGTGTGIRLDHPG